MGLPSKHSRFVQEYLVDLNGKQAAIRAGYSRKTAESQASRLLRNAQVKAAIDAAKAERAIRVEVKQDEVLEELKRIGLSDIGAIFDANGQILPLAKMDPAARRAIASIEVEELFEGFGEDRAQVGQIRKVKLWSKTEALRDLGRHLKLFTDKVQIQGPTLAELVAASMAKDGES